MGTNFYAKHIPTEQEYKEMETALANRQLDQLRELIDKADHQYHIGKRSGGWQFLFAPHIKKREGFGNSGRIVSPWEDTLDSIKEYLSRDDVQIIDEYGQEFTVDQFFNEQIGHCLYHDEKNAINGFDYDKMDPDSSKYYRTEDMEYTTEEGLRFSTDEDFC